MVQEVYFGEIQHGHMEQVGYDTYCKLLEEVIKEMQGVEIEPEEIDVQIDLNVSSYIPDEYMENSSQKIETYQNIALCRTEEDIADIVDELIDRFGPMPEELESLLEIARIKELARKAYVIKIMQKMNGIVFTFDANHFRMENVDVLLKQYRNQIKFSPGKDPYITLKEEKLSSHQVLQDIKEFLKVIK